VPVGRVVLCEMEILSPNFIEKNLSTMCHLRPGIEIGKFKLVAQTRFLIKKKKMSLCLTKL
jgi:hypothetical protein